MPTFPPPYAVLLPLATGLVVASCLIGLFGGGASACVADKPTDAPPSVRWVLQRAVAGAFAGLMAGLLCVEYFEPDRPALTLFAGGVCGFVGPVAAFRYAWPRIQLMLKPEPTKGAGDPNP